MKHIEKQYEYFSFNHFKTLILALLLTKKRKATRFKAISP